jgi:cyclase
MLNHRVIPCLLLSNDGLVKTQKFSSPKYVGDPINAIRIFNEKEVDELIVLDIDASRERRSPNFDLIEQLAGECFMPLCYGGGIKSLADVKTLFGLGIEKISLQTALAIDKKLIRQVADLYGEQSVVVSMDIKRNWLGRPKIYSRSGAKFREEDWKKQLVELVKLGAGEVLINSVDRDGMRSGMDLELIRQASSLVDVPVIAIGGVGSMADIKAATLAGASAVGCGSFFVFQGPHRAVLITYPLYEELQQLWRNH